MAAEIVRDAELKIYRGAPHGLAQTQPERFNADLLAFIEKPMKASARTDWERVKRAKESRTDEFFAP